MAKRKHQRRSKSRSNPQAIKNFSLWLAGLIILGGLIYYVSYGISGSSAFEQLPRSLVYYVADQSGLTQSDKYGNYGVHYAQPGDTVTMWMTVKNLSRNPAAYVWYPVNELPDEGKDYPYAHAIGAATANDVSPFWLDGSSFVLNGNRLTYYDGPAVHRGKYMTLAWQVKISNDAVLGSAYPLSLGLVREFDEWGIKVNSVGRTAQMQAIRWVFKISNMDVYSNMPVTTVANYSGKLVYEDLSYGLAETILSRDLNTGQTTQLFSRTRADSYSPTIYARLMDPREGIFWVGQTINDQWGYGDKWNVFTDLYNTTLAGVGVSAYVLEEDLKQSDWWDAVGIGSISPSSTAFPVNPIHLAVEKYNSRGISLYDYTNKQIISFAPRLNSSPWDMAEFSGYAQKLWTADYSKLYLGRCNADNRDVCTDGLSTWQFDQITFLTGDYPRLESASILNEQNFNTVEFDLNTGTAVGSTYSLKSGIPFPPSNIKAVDLNSGAVQSVGKSSSAAYKVEKVSADGGWMFYTMRNSTGSVDDVKTPHDKMVAFISRVGDIYQPMLVAQDFDHLKVLGWTQDNRYLAYLEYRNCNSFGCASSLKIFDTQNRGHLVTPAWPNQSMIPIAVV